MATIQKEQEGVSVAVVLVGGAIKIHLTVIITDQEGMDSIDRFLDKKGHTHPTIKVQGTDITCLNDLCSSLRKPQGDRHSSSKYFSEYNVVSFPFFLHFTNYGIKLYVFEGMVGTFLSLCFTINYLL